MCSLSFSPLKVSDQQVDVEPRARQLAVGCKHPGQDKRSEFTGRVKRSAGDEKRFQVRRPGL